MRDPLRITAVAALVAALTLLPAVACAAPAASGSTLERIDAAHAEGRIDAEQRVLYRLYRVLDRDLLPPELVAPADEERPLRCATPYLRQAMAARAWLSPAGAAAVDAALGPPLPARSEQTTSEHFAVIVGEDGGVDPATVDQWLATLENVWDVEVDQTGFDPPPCTDQYYFDVYIGGTGADVPEIENDVYGYVTHYPNDCPYMVVHASYAQGWGAAEVTAAHEFQHGIQSGYDWWEGDWWMEATAVWAEELVYPAVDDYLQYVNNGGGWMEYPEYSMFYEDGWHEYGNVTWILFIDEYHGGPATIRDMWERCKLADAEDAINGELVEGGTTLADAFIDFTALLSGRFFEDGALWDPVWVNANHSDYPVDHSIGQYTPEEYGSNYIEFHPDGGSPALLEVTLEWDDAGIEFGMALVAFDSGAATYDVTRGTGPLTLSVDDFGGAVDDVVMAVSVLSPTGLQPGAGGVVYSYQATLDGQTGDDDTGDDDTSGDDDADDDASDDGADDDGAGDDDGYGCGCRAEGRGAVAAGPALLLALLALRRRT